MGVLSYTLFRKGILRDNLRNPSHFQRDLKTLTGINQLPNDAGIVLGQGRGTAWTLPGDPPDCILAKDIQAHIGPGLPIRQMTRINFMQKDGTFIHAISERNFAG
jgi:hypothetical protein